MQLEMTKQGTRDAVRQAAILYQKGKISRSGFRMIAKQALVNEISLSFAKKSRAKNNQILSKFKGK